MSDSKPAERHPAVGIDLGTTFSAVAYLDATGRPVTIRNAEGDLTTPSAVFFDRTHPIVGIEAVEAGLVEPERLALYAKRDVGEIHYEKEIQGRRLPPEVVQALILKKLKDDAELKLGEIRKAVVTVPAFFNEPCRKATQDAGRLAGLKVLDIINEPTAAAITYGVEQGFLSADGKSKQRELILVYDLGGGTFDVTVMEINGAKYKTIATAGDVYLGGIDWDRRIVDYIVDAFEKEHDVDLKSDPQCEQELLRKANQTKHALTQRESVAIAFAHDGKRLRIDLSQSEFSAMCEDLVERTLMTVQLVLDDAKIGWDDLTRLILVGGSTRMPMVRRELEKLSSMELDRSLSPDEAVCHGAALYAGMLLGHQGESCSDIRVSNVNSHDLGILAVDSKTGEQRRQIMIPRNSALPARKRARFRTFKDNQANVKIEVVEGGDSRGINATKIGKCLVNDLPAETPKGTNVDVQFDYTPDGRLTIRAFLPEIDRKVKMKLNRAAGLGKEELKEWRDRIHEGIADPDPEEMKQIASEMAKEMRRSKIDSVTSPDAASAIPNFSPGPAPSEKITEIPDFILDSGKSKSGETSTSEKTIAASDESKTNKPTKPDDGDAAIKPAKTRPLGTPPASGQKLNLNLAENQDVPKPSVKPGAPDFAQLMGLSGGSKPNAPTDAPVISTDSPIPPDAIKLSSKKPEAKKGGGLFGRKKKTSDDG